MAKTSLLDLLVHNYPDKKREELYALVVCGKVTVSGELCKNPKERIDKSKTLAIQENHAYVSRGGEKLAHALEAWNIATKNKVWIDAGASTGGFTDVLLRKGAKQVYAVDVGYNQLDYRLRQDNRVVVMERTNVMHLTPLDPVPHGVVADLSFRSLRHAAKHLLSLTSESFGVFLLKPQFEIEKTDSFHGVIRDPKVIEDVCTQTIQRLQQEGVAVDHIIESPILGRKGNREFLLYCRLLSTQSTSTISV